MSLIRKIKAIAHIPITRKDGLEYKDMGKAFDHISNEVQKRFPNQRIRIVVSGGTCAVLYFKSREKTKDIDFLSLDPNIIEVVSGAQYTLPQDLRLRWPENWVNAEMIGYANMPGCENLYGNSIRCNVILYQSPWIVVYAADWRFQLIGKIQRAYQMELLSTHMQSIDRKGKDLQDAVAILQELVMQNGGPLTKNAIRSWYNGSALENDGLDFVNAAYYARFSQHAIV
ncbi:hypothetical protein CVT26_003744 [Gymnopilus dilepis]|uniref:DUF7582 domain-containing protein n=1 Tax=Gymnopilus dilepis TaxID=231916 RepID=A0A409VS73_9AGAR|nr:hypothetical protein CVT26_003744 [Gymnopilus dilepis]